MGWLCVQWLLAYWWNWRGHGGGWRDTSLYALLSWWPLCVCVRALVCAQSLQSCPTLCDPMDCSPLLVHGVLQARILERVAMPSSRGSSWPRYRTWISRNKGEFFTAEPPGEPQPLFQDSLQMSGTESLSPSQISQISYFCQPNQRFPHHPYLKL